MFKGLKARWEVKSNLQFAIIFSVFAINGSLTAWIAKPVISWLGLTAEIIPLIILVPLRFILILPLWMLMLVIIGALLGQGSFFWNFVKKMLYRFLPKKKRLEQTGSVSK